MQPKTNLRNNSNKLVWLSLNSGTAVPIPARKTAEVAQAELAGNRVFAKLCDQKILAVEPGTKPSKANPERSIDTVTPKAKTSPAKKK